MWRPLEAVVCCDFHGSAGRAWSHRGKSLADTLVRRGPGYESGEAGSSARRVAQALDEHRRHPAVVVEVVAGDGLTQQAHGVEELARVDVGVDLAGRASGRQPDLGPCRKRLTLTLAAVSSLALTVPRWPRPPVRRRERSTAATSTTRCTARGTPTPSAASVAATRCSAAAEWTASRAAAILIIWWAAPAPISCTAVSATTRCSAVTATTA